jgi:serine/threonine protein kinase
MNRSIDSRSDFYSLGVTFYQMLAGPLPFTVLDPMEWAHFHIARRPLAPRVGAIHQNMGRLQVLVDEAASVGLADGRGDREAQEAPQLHRRSDDHGERFAAGVLERQHGPTVFADELNRPRHPGAIQFAFQFKLMGQAVEGGGRRAFSNRQLNQHAVPVATGPRAPGLGRIHDHHPPQDLEALICRRRIVRSGSSPGLRPRRLPDAI